MVWWRGSFGYTSGYPCPTITAKRGKPRGIVDAGVVDSSGSARSGPEGCYTSEARES